MHEWKTTHVEVLKRYILSLVSNEGISFFENFLHPVSNLRSTQISDKGLSFTDVILLYITCRSEDEET